MFFKKVTKMKESNKKSFIILNSWMKPLNMLDPVEFKNIINNLHRIDNDEDIIINTREEQMMWYHMEYMAHSNKLKWLNKSKANQENGAKGGRPKNDDE